MTPNRIDATAAYLSALDTAPSRHVADFVHLSGATTEEELAQALGELTSVAKMAMRLLTIDREVN